MAEGHRRNRIWPLWGPVACINLLDAILDMPFKEVITYSIW